MTAKDAVANAGIDSSSGAGVVGVALSASCGERVGGRWWMKGRLESYRYIVLGLDIPADLCASGGHGALCPWRKPGVPLPRSGKL